MLQQDWLWNILVLIAYLKHYVFNINNSYLKQVSLGYY